MVDLSSLKAPGWQRVVAELNAPAPDDRAFLVRLVSALGQVSGARQAALFLVEPVAAETGGEARVAEARAVFVWPVPAAGGQPPEMAPDVRTAARAAAESGQTRVFGLDKQEGYYE